MTFLQTLLEEHLYEVSGIGAELKAMKRKREAAERLRHWVQEAERAEMTWVQILPTQLRS